MGLGIDIEPKHTGKALRPKKRFDGPAKVKGNFTFIKIPSDTGQPEAL